MRVYCGKDYEEASKIAAGLIAAQVVMKRMKRVNWIFQR